MHENAGLPSSAFTKAEIVVCSHLATFPVAHSDAMAGAGEWYWPAMRARLFSTDMDVVEPFNIRISSTSVAHALSGPRVGPGHIISEARTLDIDSKQLPLWALVASASVQLQVSILRRSSRPPLSRRDDVQGLQSSATATMMKI